MVLNVLCDDDASVVCAFICITRWILNVLCSKFEARGMTLKMQYVRIRYKYKRVFLCYNLRMVLMFLFILLMTQVYAGRPLVTQQDLAAINAEYDNLRSRRVCTLEVKVVTNSLEPQVCGSCFSISCEHEDVVWGELAILLKQGAEGDTLRAPLFEKYLEAMLPKMTQERIPALTPLPQNQSIFPKNTWICWRVGPADWILRDKIPGSIMLCPAGQKYALHFIPSQDMPTATQSLVESEKRSDEELAPPPSLITDLDLFGIQNMQKNMLSGSVCTIEIKRVRKIYNIPMELREVEGGLFHMPMSRYQGFWNGFASLFSGNGAAFHAHSFEEFLEQVLPNMRYEAIPGIGEMRSLKPIFPKDEAIFWRVGPADWILREKIPGSITLHPFGQSYALHFVPYDALPRSAQIFQDYQELQKQNQRIKAYAQRLGKQVSDLRRTVAQKDQRIEDLTNENAALKKECSARAEEPDPDAITVQQDRGTFNRIRRDPPSYDECMRTDITFAEAFKKILCCCVCKQSSQV